jgi:hypothetical protein
MHIPGDFRSATQKSWRGLGSKAAACCHEASAKTAVMRRRSLKEAIVFIVWVMGDVLAAEGGWMWLYIAEDRSIDRGGKLLQYFEQQMWHDVPGSCYIVL